MADDTYFFSNCNMTLAIVSFCVSSLASNSFLCFSEASHSWQIIIDSRYIQLYYDLLSLYVFSANSTNTRKTAEFSSSIFLNTSLIVIVIQKQFKIFSWDKPLIFMMGSIMWHRIIVLLQQLSTNRDYPPPQSEYYWMLSTHSLATLPTATSLFYLR